jgi:hypothetical protein
MVIKHSEIERKLTKLLNELIDEEKEEDIDELEDLAIELSKRKWR